MRTASSIGSCFSRQPLAQRLALDERHHVEEEPIGVARVEQRQDVRMLQLGGGLDLGEEALGAEHGRELGVQHLDGDLAVVLEVLREIDRRHAARAELALDRVAIGKGCGEVRNLRQSPVAAPWLQGEGSFPPRSCALAVADENEGTEISLKNSRNAASCHYIRNPALDPAALHISCPGGSMARWNILIPTVYLSATALDARPAVSQTLPDAILGRWDMTVRRAQDSFPSWLEVRLSGNRTLVGQFVGEFGSARPIARIDFTNRARFVIPPATGRAPPPCRNRPWPAPGFRSRRGVYINSVP